MRFWKGFSAEIIIVVGKGVGRGAGIDRDINDGVRRSFGRDVGSWVGGDVDGDVESDNDRNVLFEGGGKIGSRDDRSVGKDVKVVFNVIIYNIVG